MSKRITGLFALALSLSLAACGDGTSAADPGTLTLLLTDDAGDFTQAVVTVERIELVGSGGPVVLDVPFTTDLLTLSNDIETLVEDVTIPGGTYTGLRFIIPEACIAVEQEEPDPDLVYASDGFAECGAADGSLQLPSFDETGIHVTFPNGSIQVDGDARILLLDFIVSESFGQVAGASGSWVMHPVIHATDISLSGGIVVELTTAEGVELPVGSSLADFEASLDTETEPQPFTDEDGDGTYTATFLYLAPDPADAESYAVSVELNDEAPALSYTLSPTPPVTGVRFDSGAQTTVAFEVTSAGTP